MRQSEYEPLSQAEDGREFQSQAMQPSKPKIYFGDEDSPFSPPSSDDEDEEYKKHSLRLADDEEGLHIGGRDRRVC